MKEVWRKIWVFKVTRAYLYACWLRFWIAFRRLPSWGEIKLPTPLSTLIDPFSAATETLVLGNLIKLVWFSITFARVLCHWGNEKNKVIVIFSSSLSPSGKLPVRMWCQLQGLSAQLKNGRLEVLELVALFLLKTETCKAKNCWEFFLDAIFCLVKIGFEKRWTNTK